MTTEVLRHVIDSISPRSPAHAEAARVRVAHAGLPMLDGIAARLGGAQHTAVPRCRRRTIVIVASDGRGPRVGLGEAHPTAITAHAISDGTAAVARLARPSATPIVLIDAGVHEPAVMPTATIQLADPNLEAGVAVVISLADHGLDVLALGAMGLATNAPGDDPRAGGTAVLAGMILGAASVQIPVVLDGLTTVEAALLATNLAPTVADYLLASHPGRAPQPQLLGRLGLEPIFGVALGHGDGSGAAMTLPLLDQLDALLGAPSPDGALDR
ncbi:MAG: nicotinate-nucleotide--dimethylbenzimidazole phosphoribosyltransferase [Kofleriaceae bacterium]